MVRITVNNEACETQEGTTIAGALEASGTYLPTLCHHPDLPPAEHLPLASRVFRGARCDDHQPLAADAQRDLEGCGLCLVDVAGEPEPVRACHTPVQAGMAIHTDSKTLQQRRRDNLKKILAHHPHACLTCAQREGCSLEDCSSNVPKEERCCWKFHDCELRRVAEYVGVKEDTPRYRPLGMPVLDDEPLFSRDFNLCIDCTRCVRICNQVRGVEALGVVHRQGRLTVGSVAPTLMDSECKFCGACVEVCPTGCLKDKGVHGGDRQQWLVPCVRTCPAGVDVPEYIRRIAAGDFSGAAAVVWEQLPLAHVLGHICFHLCECDCRRSEVDDPLAICALKRFALQEGKGAALRAALGAAESGKHVAVVGSGPAGLSAAYFLKFMGHAVTVFEARDTPGGMPALSVPSYRLPQVVLDKDLAVIRDLGVQIKTGSDLGTAQAMTDLLNQGFDALLVAVGLPRSKKISVPGSDLDGVLWGLEFLEAAKTGATLDLGRKVVVVGGGNVAIDVAMTALRLSGGTVRLFCLEARQDMPAHDHEIEQAESEGVDINSAWGPAEIQSADGKVRAVAFRRCLSVFSQQGAFAPTFDECQTMTAEAETVILAIGQQRPQDLPASGPGVFWAGDVATDSAAGGSVVHAVASGRAAAEDIDRYCGGNGSVSMSLTDHAPPSPRLGRDEGFAPRGRVLGPCEDPQERRQDFRPLEATYTREQAQAEAARCLQCDLRLMIAAPTLPPQQWWALTEAQVDPVPVVEGVFIITDQTHKPIMIKGTSDLHASLKAELETRTEAHFFRFEEDRMYTKRESELIQQHLTQYGELPGGGDDELDDLF